MKRWRFIDSGASSAHFNMALDESLAVSVRNRVSPPTLRIYEWRSPSLTIGAFQKFNGINLDFCYKNNVPVVRRLTGGRAVLHCDDLTYSLSASNEDEFSGSLIEVYMKIGAAFDLFFRKLGLECDIIKDKTERQRLQSYERTAVCFNSTSAGEISFSGQKLIGSAQKRWPEAFMQQGSIPLSVNTKTFHGIFGDKSKPIKGLNEFIQNTQKNRLKDLLISSFEEAFNIILEHSHPSKDELEFAARLASVKYPDLAAQEAKADIPS